VFRDLQGAIRKQSTRLARGAPAARRPRVLGTLDAGDHVCPRRGNPHTVGRGATGPAAGKPVTRQNTARGVSIRPWGVVPPIQRPVLASAGLLFRGKGGDARLEDVGCDHGPRRWSRPRVLRRRFPFDSPVMVSSGICPLLPGLYTRGLPWRAVQSEPEELGHAQESERAWRTGPLAQLAVDLRDISGSDRA